MLDYIAGSGIVIIHLKMQEVNLHRKFNVFTEKSLKVTDVSL